MDAQGSIPSMSTNISVLCSHFILIDIVIGIPIFHYTLNAPSYFTVKFKKKIHVY
jgi:hypothetical protein